MKKFWQRLSVGQPTDLKTLGLKLEHQLYQLNLKRTTAILLTLNVGFYLYLQKTSQDYNQRLYYSTTRWMSRVTGNMAQRTIPISIRKRVLEAYCNFYDVVREDMVEPDLERYETFLDFFTRAVKPRTYSTDINQLIVPADSRVLSYSEIDDNSVLLVKDIKYSLGHFLTGDPNLVLKGRFLEELKKREDVKTKLYSIIFYLAPGDYHRFHCPTDLDLKTRNHILGELEPVKVSHISRKAGVYEGNERVSLFGQSAQGLMAMIIVGALNVGSIVLNFDELVRTNVKFSERPSRKAFARSYSHVEEVKQGDKIVDWVDRGLSIERGQEMGMFRLGSTVVLVIEAQSIEWHVQPGQRVRWGDTFATVK